MELGVWSQLHQVTFISLKSTLYLKVTFIDCDCTRNFINIVIYPKIIAFVHIDGIRGVVSTPSSHFYIT